jgi:hypothetical protein
MSAAVEKDPVPVQIQIITIGADLISAADDLKTVQFVFALLIRWQLGIPAEKQPFLFTRNFIIYVINFGEFLWQNNNHSLIKQKKSNTKPDIT